MDSIIQTQTQTRKNESAGAGSTIQCRLIPRAEVPQRTKRLKNPAVAELQKVLPELENGSAFEVKCQNEHECVLTATRLRYLNESRVLNLTVQRSGNNIIHVFRNEVS